MIRFVDLTEAYWTDGGPPCCAFLNTIDDRFLESPSGGHTFDSPEDVNDLPSAFRDRCASLVPEGFWAVPSKGEEL